jgi:hypothetical protein
MLTKTHCAQCKAFADCPNETKFFVNYCGSQAKNFQSKIEIALSSCVSHRGLNYISFRSNEYHSAIMRDTRHMAVYV